MLGLLHKCNLDFAVSTLKDHGKTSLHPHRVTVIFYWERAISRGGNLIEHGDVEGGRRPSAIKKPHQWQRHNQLGVWCPADRHGLLQGIVEASKRAGGRASHTK
jgi:hypothetical protein